MAAFKRHAALNFWRGEELRGGPSSDEAMGQFGRLTGVEDLPPDAELDAIIREAAELTRQAPSPRKAKAAKPQPAIHPEFAEALERSPKAKATLDSFPPSARRDYCEWISSAKQVSTRANRITTAIEWLCEGKRRNWKYEKC